MVFHPAMLISEFAVGTRLGVRGYRRESREHTRVTRGTGILHLQKETHEWGRAWVKQPELFCGGLVGALTAVHTVGERCSGNSSSCRAFQGGRVPRSLLWERWLGLAE